MIDTLLFNIEKLYALLFWDDYKLAPNQYFILTLHRPSNVDVVDAFKKLLRTIGEVGEATRKLPVISPVHPKHCQA